MIDADRETRLEECVQRLDAAHRLDEVQAIARRAPRDLVGAGGATFVLRDADECFYADEDAMSPLWKGQRFPTSRCISGWAMIHGETAVVPDISVDDRIPLDAYRPTFVRSLVMVPVGHPPVAAIGAYWPQLHAPSTQVISVLERVAAAVGAAVGRIGLAGAPVNPVLRRELAGTRAHPW